MVKFTLTHLCINYIFPDKQDWNKRNVKLLHKKIYNQPSNWQYGGKSWYESGAFGKGIWRENKPGWAISAQHFHRWCSLSKCKLDFNEDTIVITFFFIHRRWNKFDSFNLTLKGFELYRSICMDLNEDSSLFQTIGAAFGAKKIDVEGKYLTLGIWVRMNNSL